MALEEADLQGALAPTDPIALLTGVVPREGGAASAEVEVAAAAGVLRMEVIAAVRPLTIKVLLKATWEGTIATSQGQRKIPTIRMAVSMLECLSSTVHQTRPMASVRDTEIMKVR